MLSGSRYQKDFWGPKMQAYFAAKDWVPRVDPHHIYRGHVAVDAIIAEIEPKPYRPKFFAGLALESGFWTGGILRRNL